MKAKPTKPVASYLEANGSHSTFGFQTLSEIRTFVCPINPECPKSEGAEIQTDLRSDFRLHCTFPPSFYSFSIQWMSEIRTSGFRSF